MDYSTQDGHIPGSSPVGHRKSGGKAPRHTDSDDTDFQEESEDEDEVITAGEDDAPISGNEMEAPSSKQRPRGLLASPAPPSPVDSKSMLKGLVAYGIPLLTYIRS